MLASPPQLLDVSSAADAYLAAWESLDPDRIAALHSDDTRFVLHATDDAPAPAVGRLAVRNAFAAVFAQWPGFAFETHRLLLGADHWVLDWTLHATPAGRPVSVPLLDVTVLDADGLVARKDTYLAVAA